MKTSIFFAERHITKFEISNFKFNFFEFYKEIDVLSPDKSFEWKKAVGVETAQFHLLS